MDINHRDKDKEKDADTRSEVGSTISSLVNAVWRTDIKDDSTKKVDNGDKLNHTPSRTDSTFESTPRKPSFQINSSRLLASVVRKYPYSSEGSNRRPSDLTHFRQNSPPSNNPALDKYIASTSERYASEQSRKNLSPSKLSYTSLTSFNSNGSTSSNKSRITARQRAHVKLRSKYGAYNNYSRPPSNADFLSNLNSNISSKSPSISGISSYTSNNSFDAHRYPASTRRSLIFPGGSTLKSLIGNTSDFNSLNEDILNSSLSKSKKSSRISLSFEPHHSEKKIKETDDDVNANNNENKDDNGVITISDDESDDEYDSRYNNMVSLDTGTESESDNDSLSLAYIWSKLTSSHLRRYGKRNRENDVLGRKINEKYGLFKKVKSRRRVRPKATINTHMYDMLKKLESERKSKEEEIYERKLQEQKQLELELKRFDEGKIDDLISSELDKKIKPVKKIDPSLVPLTEAQNKIIDEAFSMENDMDILCTSFNISILVKDIRTLLPKQWLNDEIINFYGNLIMDRSKTSETPLPKIHVFNTFFLTQLSQDYMKVRSWSRRFDLFGMDKILIPTHLGNHWICSCINLRDKRIEIYDSLGGRHQNIAKTLINYLVKDWEDKKIKKKLATEPFNTEDWETNYKNPNIIPQQLNGYDCGVFTCSFMENLSRDIPFGFSQDNMNEIRRRMVFEIISRRLNY